MSRRLLPFAALAALALVGCGKQGPLERPGPLFGGPAEPGKVERQPPRPVGTVDRRDRGATDDLPPIADAPAPAAGP